MPREKVNKNSSLERSINKDKTVIEVQLAKYLKAKGKNERLKIRKCHQSKRRTSQNLLGIPEDMQEIQRTRTLKWHKEKRVRRKVFGQARARLI